ncbi:protein Bouncer-like [Esox lucius]|uniref:protein Bouncer-like n=1 Tax=Esox lucius TaxID=8010 RepID=UPI0014769D02|nr:protein Bouncer-like [Esox lucius]
MESLRKHRLTSQLLAPADSLCILLLILSLAGLGSSTPIDSPSPHLLCNVCPLQHKERSCSSHFTTECHLNERCGTSTGHFGSIHILSAQGCLTYDLCNSTHPVLYRGVSYNVTYRCCCRNRCNHPLAPEMHTERLSGGMTEPSEVPPMTNDPLDRCPGD